MRFAAFSVMLVLTGCSSGATQDQPASGEIVRSGARVVRQDQAVGCPSAPTQLMIQPPPPDIPTAGKPIKVAPPDYPPCADLRRVPGVVDLIFTVEPDGSVGEPRVVQEAPAGFGFAKAAIAAFSQWRFQPKLVDGKPVAFQATSRMSWQFNPPGGHG